jgi:UDP-N-acetylmuramate--alanine ligase
MRHKVKRVHFVGIGGAGMSGIAEVLLTLRYKVSGSDLAESTATRRLRRLGARVHLGHAAEHIADADAVVVSTAVKDDNPEVAAARARGTPVVPRALMLAELMRLKQGIAVAGTHGKTTTTSLVASVLAEGGLDPTFVIGGRLEAAGSNARLGAGEFIVVEADESDASFLYLQPVLAVVTNIDADHMETYDHSLDRLRQAFVDFLQRLPFYGAAVLCADDPNLRLVQPQLTKPITTYGLAPDAHVRAFDVAASGGQMRFRVARGGAEASADLAITLNLPGVHNVRNALAAIAVGLELGVPEARIVKALAEFRGVGRRFQNYGKVRLARGGAFTLIDDYGHHPAEMAATLAAARGAFPRRRILLAFQPHRYTRTRDCFEDFVSVLSTADALVLTEVYSAGEAPIVAADGRALARAVRVQGRVEPVFVEKVANLGAAILAAARDGDVVLTMGAGSIGGVAAQLANRVRSVNGAA